VVRAPAIPRPRSRDPRADEFRDRGYVVARGVFTGDEAAELLAEVQRARVRADVNADGLTRDWMEFRSNLFFSSPALQALASDQRLVDLLAPIAGGDLWVRWDQAVGKKAGAGVFPWHQDNAYNELAVEHFQVWVALTEMTPDNGSLWLDPRPARSRRAHPHHKVGPDMVYLGEVVDPVMVEAAPGDVVVFSSRMLHMTTPNTTDAVRWAYVLEYMRLADVDPFVPGPRFVAARGGRSAPGFVDALGSERSPANVLRYAGPVVRARRLLHATRARRRARGR
jgi:hypothetical protein